MPNDKLTPPEETDAPPLLYGASEIRKREIRKSLACMNGDELQNMLVESSYKFLLASTSSGLDENAVKLGLRPKRKEQNVNLAVELFNLCVISEQLIERLNYEVEIRGREGEDEELREILNDAKHKKYKDREEDEDDD
jgi:hypothetical protein